MEVKTHQQNNSTRREEVTFPIRYCLYARKSTEQDEKQALSIDSQIKEMTQIAERDGLNIADIKRESHSAKATGQRPVFNELLQDIREDRFDGIITWAPDRLSRNAGDLGAVVDLMDSGKIKEIRTYGQTFTDNPNEKFLLMILGSQAKLENDNKRINVKRGLRARCEQGLWPASPPFGYMANPDRNKKCHMVPDPHSSHIIKKIFEKVAYEHWTGRRIQLWLKHEAGFKTENGNALHTSTITSILRRDFYYGRFEYPAESGNWYTGVHKPLITKELFDKAQEVLDERKRPMPGYGFKKFAFSRMMKCGKCGSGITADRKIKHQKNGNINKFVYYGCTRAKDASCKGTFMNEKHLLNKLKKIIDEIELDNIKIKGKIEQEVKKFSHFNQMVFNDNQKTSLSKEASIKGYMKYTLQYGSRIEKRQILLCIKSQVMLEDKRVYLE